MTNEEARRLIDSFAQESREAHRLALAASLAVRVETELVRALRFYLFPDSDPGIEADLWFSPLVQSQTPLAIEFEPEVQELLRRDLAGDQELLAGAWGVLERSHSGAPYALRLEEELTWLGLSGAQNETIIERRLQSVIAALRFGQRVGLARWASRALPTLPEKARDTEAARRLSVVAGMQTGVGPVLAAAPSTGVDDEWLSEFTAQKITRVKVGVRLLKDEAETPQAGGSGGGSAAPDDTPMLVEFSLPPAPESEQVEVPDTYRLLLEVSWQAPDGPRLRQLSLLPGETRTVGVGYGEVVIRTALGDIYTLRPHFEHDLLILYHAAAERWARRLIRRTELEKWNGERLKVVASPIVPPAVASEEGEELKALFCASRKVGLVISDVFMRDADILPWLEISRPEPRGRRDWLIQLNAAEAAPAVDAGGSVVNFDGGSEKFEQGFRAFWKAITGEDLPVTETSPEPSTPRDTNRVNVFISSAHKDQKLRDQLMSYLAPLVSEGMIESWHDRSLSPGTEWQSEVDSRLQNAEIILLLVSPDFLASDYIFDVEMKAAMEMHEAGKARVIPIILRPCDWQSAPFGKLQALPENARPITKWRRRSDAFEDIVERLRTYIEQIGRVTRPNLIPRPPSFGFVARRDSQGRDIVGLLTGELVPGESHLVAIWGPGGTGKTTLAAEVARALRDDFPQRLAWVSVLGRPGFSLKTLLDDIATQLGRADLRHLAPDPKAEQVRALLAEAPSLVVLDNFEIIEPDEQARCIGFLAEGTECSALITTRERINHADVNNVGLAAMEMDDAREFWRRLVEQSGRPSAFDGLDADEIIRHCEANPLVIQWVVGQIELAQRPQDALAYLSQGLGDAAERVFDRSFNLPQLGDDARAVLLSLSLFTSSATREALAAVAGFEDATRLSEAVERLVGLWLVKSTDGGRRLAITGLTRTLAAARLSRDPRAAEFRRRFVAYFVRYAVERREPTPENYDALEEEKDSLLRTADEAYASEDWGIVTQIALTLARPVNGMLSVRGYWDEVVRLGTQALQAARNSQDEASVAALSLNLAVTYTNRGEFDAARRLYYESLEIYRRLDSKNAVAIALRQLGRLMQETGDFEQARSLYHESLEINKELGHQAGVAVALYQMAALSKDVGDREEARRLYAESLELNKRLGDMAGVAAAVNQLGSLAREQGESEDARRLYGESLEIKRKLGDQFGIAESLQGLGALAAGEGGGDEARRLLEESLAIYKRLGSKKGVGEALHRLGQLAGLAGDYDEAVRLEREALEIFDNLQSPYAKAVRDALSELERRASGATGNVPWSQGDIVFLAEVTPDLLDARASVGDELLARGYRVLPDKPLAVDSAHLREDVRDCVRQSVLSIHLVGASYGLTPEGEDLSLAHLQYHLASELAPEANLNLMVWLPRNLEISDERQRAMLREIESARQVELLRTSLEDLKTIVVDRLRQLKTVAADAGPRPARSVYLIHTPQDRDMCRPIVSHLFDEGLDVITSVGDGDAPSAALEKHRRNLMNTDGAIIYYGEADELWVRKNLEDLEKAYGYGRQKDWAATAVYVGSPLTKQKEDFRTYMAPYVIHNFHTFRPEDLREFIRAVREDGGRELKP